MDDNNSHMVKNSKTQILLLESAPIFYVFAVYSVARPSSHPSPIPSKVCRAKLFERDLAARVPALGSVHEFVLVQAKRRSSDHQRDAGWLAGCATKLTLSAATPPHSLAATCFGCAGLPTGMGPCALVQPGQWIMQPKTRKICPFDASQWISCFGTLN